MANMKAITLKTREDFVNALVESGHPGNGAGEQETESPLPERADLSDLLQGIMAPPEFVVDPIIPKNEATLFGGHGGAGKSILAMVILAHVACGKHVGPLIVKQQCHVAYISFEDPLDLVKYRLARITEQFMLSIETVLENFHIYDATDMEPMAYEASSGGVRTLIVQSRIIDWVRGIAHECPLLAIDNASDAFDGNENERRQVRKFIRYLTRVARDERSAILLLAHIDKVAARFGSSGNSYSGSTQWHNSVRSRIALIDDELHHEKLNYGKKLENPLKVEWDERGVPYLLSPSLVGASDDDGAILECIRLANQRGEIVSTAKAGAATAWHTLRDMPEYPENMAGAKDGRDRLNKAIGRLLADKKIEREDYKDSYRNAKQKWVVR